MSQNRDLLVHHQYSEYLENDYLLLDCQYGFRKSPLLNGLQPSSLTITKSLDTIIIHAMFLAKLKSYGVTNVEYT